MKVFGYDIGYASTGADSQTLPGGETMVGTILVYGNESMLVTTRGLILEKAGYGLYTSSGFAGAMLTLMTQQIDILLLCQSLSEEERRGILRNSFCAPIGYEVCNIRSRLVAKLG
jgi:hypothetical protein